MFVSSYSTYIQANSLDKSAKERLEQRGDSFSRFDSKAPLFQTKPAQELTALTQKLPLDYISDYKVLSNQQKLHKEKESIPKEKSKFTQILTLTNAQEAYTQNATLFMLSKKPKPALEQTPSHYNENTNALKYKVISTYIANDNYFKLTA